MKGRMLICHVIVCYVMTDGAWVKENKSFCNILKCEHE